jgi:hypothetical protein
MNSPMSQRDINIQSVLSAGDLIGAGDLATRIAKNGGSVADLYRQFLARGSVPDGDQMLGLSPSDSRGYSLLNLVRSQAEGKPSQARFEKDLSSLVAAKTGVVANGEWVPFGVLARDFNIFSDGNNAANLLGDGRLGALAGDPLRQVFTLGRLGATFFGGLKSTAAVPVFTSAEAATFESEIGMGPEVFHESRLVTLTPYTVRAVFEMSLQAVFQATPELESAARRLMMVAIDEAMQAGIFAGDGSGVLPTGILNNADRNLVAGGTDGATLTFQHLIDMENACATDNVAPGARGWVINAATQKYLRTKARASGLPFILGDDNQVLGAPVHVTNALPSDLTKGSGTALNGLIYGQDWSQLLVGIYGGGIDVTVDRVTLAAQGQLRVVCALTFGWGMRYPEAFCAMKDAKLS